MMAIAAVVLATFLDPLRLVGSAICALVASRLRAVFAIPIIIICAIALSVGITEFLDRNLSRGLLSSSSGLNPELNVDQLIEVLKRDNIWEDRNYFIGVHSWQEYQSVKTAVADKRENCRVLAAAYAGYSENQYQEASICKEVSYIGGSLGTILQIGLIWLAIWYVGYRRRMPTTTKSTTSI